MDDVVYKRAVAIAVSATNAGKGPHIFDWCTDLEGPGMDDFIDTNNPICEELFTNYREIPTKPGIYVADVRVRAWQDNTMDSVDGHMEWDLVNIRWLINTPVVDPNETNIPCPKCGRKLFKELEEIPEYPYFCVYCDENFLSIECGPPVIDYFTPVQSYDSMQMELAERVLDSLDIDILQVNILPGEFSMLQQIVREWKGQKKT